ncbi:MAG: bifunctional oligoribonuclease/PAP phosphatase NrnA [Bacteroidota bacterium]
MTSLFEKCKSIINEKKTFVLTTHVNPDGDGIGSEVALARYLRKCDKEVTIINHSATPPNYQFLDPKNEIIHFSPTLHSGKIRKGEVIFIVDTNHLTRLRSLEPYVRESTAIKICIDHHLDKDDTADLYLIDEPATATGEIIYHLIQYLDGDKIDTEIARALYTAIMTDTGSFRFPKTDPEIHQIAALLIQRGADPPEIFQEVYEKGTVNALQLLGKALANLKTVHDGRVAYMIMTREMFRETGTSEYQTENFIDYTMRIGGVQIGLLFNELPDGVKISLRSKGQIPINELAKDFGGNGHLNAAGARLFNQKLDGTVQAVLERSLAYLE